ncbi:MAG: hypothetical protein L0922_05730 [Candidatus Mariimomonas ferrooxydans]
MEQRGIPKILVCCLINKLAQFCHSRLPGIVKKDSRSESPRRVAPTGQAGMTMQKV